MQVSSTTAHRKLRHTFEEFELPKLLEEIRMEYPNCEISLECPGFRKPRKRILVFQKGDLGFCGHRYPRLEEYVDLMHNKISGDWIDRIFEDTQINMQEEMSPLQFIQRLISFRVIQKTDILKLQISAFLLALEPVYYCAGQLTIKILGKQERLLPVEWRLIQLALKKRQRTWEQLATNNCSMNSVPILTDRGIAFLSSLESNVEEPTPLVQFIQQTIDNRSNIIDLAHRERKDPLSVAQKLTEGCIKGWVTFLDQAQEPSFNERGRILVIDENNTTRKLLVRLLQSCYDAFETAGSLEAVSMIGNKQINAIIVSHSVPLSAGFSLCRVIRQNPSFKHLPIIFISNKENLFAKAKAKMAGVTEYLTHPVDQAKILSTLDLHI